MTACRTAPESVQGTPIVQNGVTVNVTSSELRYLELEGLAGGVTTERPYFVVNMTVSNASEAAVRYDLNWGASATTQAQSALLFAAPVVSAPMTSGVAVQAVAFLSDLELLEDPVTATEAIAPGATMTDVLVYEAPPEGVTELVLSVPPSVFGADNPMPAYFRIPYTATEVAPLPATALGSPHVGPDFTFTAISAALEWVPLTNTTDGNAGFSDHAVLKISFRLDNTSDAPIVYAPPRVSNSEAPPTLSGGLAPIASAAFAPTISVEGADTSRVSVPAGGSHTGFWLFEPPVADVTSLRLSLPGKRFGSTGAIRVDIPYAHHDVPEPEALTPQVVEGTPE
ncbi:MAG: hypothetical protein ACJAYU_004167 [Bradymonadia bacterium]|jgi:hypothetical protein